MNHRPKIIDLFCGCGGFGLGAEQAGFDTLAAVDIDQTLQSAYKFNFPNTHVINGDLSLLDKDAWKLITHNQEIDGVIGGPPCQGFSRMGSGDVNDPRRSLLSHFFRNINILQPKFFVMENVEGLLDKKNIEGLHDAMSIVDSRYTVLEPMVVDASHYGAPTKRLRVIVIGYNPKFVAPLSKNDFHTNHTQITTVKDAIADIPSPLQMSSAKNDLGWKSYKKTISLSNYAKLMRALPSQNIGNKEAKEMLLEGLTSGHFKTSHTKPVIERFEKVIPGKTDSVSRAKRLHWEGLCPTLRAGTGSDRGSHQAVRPIHPSEPRVITVREAARLQGFPDWFCFHPAKWHSFRMIGNSVSPIVSESILSVIKSNLEKKTNLKAQTV